MKPNQPPQAPFPPKLDLEGFARALDELRDEAEASLGERHVAHMRKMERWGRACTALGYATAWIAPNPLSAALLSTGNVARWTIIMHHVGHRGLDRVEGVPERYLSRVFAQGSRRVVDWLDWMLPEAWHYEHDVLHHSRTGELEDPDLVEENAKAIRELEAPAWVKHAIVAFYATTWKLSYYAPSTFQALCASRRRRAGLPREEREPHYVEAFNPLTADGREFWRRCVLPYATVRFAAIPALFLPLGPIAVANVLANSVLAEGLANLHSFLIIVPNHAGEDVYRFEGKTGGRGDFYLRQITGSANYTGGDDLRDFLLGYLNYQIEHHLFPDLPPLAYRELRPRVREVCARFGVPYVEESVFSRARKMLRVMTGSASMKRRPPEPKTVARPRASMGGQDGGHTHAPGREPRWRGRVTITTAPVSARHARICPALKTARSRHDRGDKSRGRLLVIHSYSHRARSFE